MEFSSPEITPEMIEAGQDVIEAWGSVSSAGSLAVQVFEAMLSRQVKPLRNEGGVQAWRVGGVEIWRANGQVGIVSGTTLNVSVPEAALTFHAGGLDAVLGADAPN